VSAKNLLLDRTCENCCHASSLCSLKTFKEASDSSWAQLTGERKEDICLSSVLYDTIFYCQVNNHTLPKELTCNYWEKGED